MEPRTRTSTQKAESLVARLVGLSDPSAAAKICEALASCLEEAAAGTVDDTLALEAGRLASVRHPHRSDVLLSVGRLYLAAGLLERAYRSLADALKAGALGPRPYRLIGETLLRLGDAQMAMPMLKRAMLERCDDPDTPSWYACAKAYVPMQEAQGSDAVARDVLRRRGAEPSTKEPPLPRFPSLLDCSEISGMATKRMAKKQPSLPPPLPPEPRTRTDAPCTLSLDEPNPRPPSDAPIPIMAEDSSVDQAETVIRKPSARPPPLPTQAKGSVKPPPLPPTPPAPASEPASASEAASATEPAPDPASAAAPASAPASAPATGSAPASPPAPASAPGSKVRVDQRLWESEVTPKNLPSPAAPAARRRRDWRWLQGAALLLVGAIGGFTAGTLRSNRSSLQSAGAAQAGLAASAESAIANASPAEATATARVGDPAPSTAASASAAVHAASTAAPTASAATRRVWPPIDAQNPASRLHSSADIAVVAGCVPAGIAVAPAIAAGERALAVAPRRPPGRVWP